MVNRIWIFQGLIPWQCNLKVTILRCLYLGFFFFWLTAPESTFKFMGFSEFVKHEKSAGKVESFLDFKIINVSLYLMLRQHKAAIQTVTVGVF